MPDTKKKGIENKIYLRNKKNYFEINIIFKQKKK